MVKTEDIIEELQKLSNYAEILGNPDEYFIHMNGHHTALSLVLCAFDIAYKSEYIIQTLKKQLNSEWNLCSERLPESYERLIVYTKSKYIYLARFREGKFIDIEYNIFSVKQENVINDVIAWRTLPTPYKNNIIE